jgi:hypothetical protein
MNSLVSIYILKFNFITSMLWCIFQMFGESKHFPHSESRPCRWLWIRISTIDDHRPSSFNSRLRCWCSRIFVGLDEGFCPRLAEVVPKVHTPCSLHETCLYVNIVLFSEPSTRDLWMNAFGFANIRLLLKRLLSDEIWITWVGCLSVSTVRTTILSVLATLIWIAPLPMTSVLHGLQLFRNSSRGVVLSLVRLAHLVCDAIRWIPR